ncbi:hypothetical protein [Kineobactrum salinum]|uniref:Uncharacterized protein n=1 Tax=Kineobactrum salinum TaxID=2708301 RepID=A0A6C0U4S5_9GAMM|nr:hypothetical protein [Kineobactrum salinum]QIB67152.1 hypothetical protein G3T16_18845 [Kineobactrum salinum]
MSYEMDEIMQEIFGEDTYSEPACVSLLNAGSSRCQQPEADPRGDSLLLEYASDGHSAGLHSTCHWMEM